MKNKLVWIMAGILCLIGLLIMTLSFMLVKFDFTAYRTGKYTEKNYQVDGDKVDAIHIKEISNDVLIEESEDDGIHLTYYEDKSKSVEYTITEENEVLTIARKNKLTFSFWQLNFFDELGVKIKLQIPKDKKYTLYVKNVSGDIKIKNADLQKVTLKTLSGEIKASYNSTYESKIESTSGDIDLENVASSSKIGIKTVSGEISAGTLTSSNISIKTTSGDIRVYKINATSTNVKTVSGEVRLRNIKANKNLTLKTTSGDIIANKIISNKISINTISGEVRGYIDEVETNYTVIVNTISGDHNLRNQTGTTDKKLSIETTSGDIKVSFKRD